MPLATGRSLSLSPARTLIADLMHACRHIPLIPIERRMSLAPLVMARARCESRPSWVAIVAKAFALVAERRPELRRSYLSYPRPRLYEHPESVVAVIVERSLDGEMAILPAVHQSPENESIEELDRWLKSCKHRPIDEVGSFRRVLRISKWPWLLRRCSWWLGQHWLGGQRARHFGTFGISVTAGFGAETLALRSPLTTCLHYGQFQRDGTVPMRMTFDHRVLDGATAARALVDLESTLLTDAIRELRREHYAAAA